MDFDGKLTLSFLLIIFILMGPTALGIAESVNQYQGERYGSYEVVTETFRIVTAYNVGDPGQNHGDPCIGASGENICHALNEGKKLCAANFVPLGSLLHIDKFGVCRVSDRMNRRYRNRVDIAMKLNERSKAKKFGKKTLRVKILKEVSNSKKIKPILDP